MFDDAGTAGRRDQAGAGRQVQAAGTVTARADGIDGRGAVRNRGVHGELAHRAGEAADLFGRLALGAQAGEQRTRKGRRHVAVRELDHQRVRLLLGQRFAVQQSIKHCTEFLAHERIRRKLAISRSPSGVNTLSG